MKHNSFKQIISALAIILFLAPVIQAQTTAAVFIQKNKTSDFVFEGEVISQACDYSLDKTTIQTKNTVRVHKIFQGDQRDAICEIVTPGGITDDRFLIYALELADA